MKHVYVVRAFGMRVPLFVVILLQFVRQNSNALSIVKFSMRDALLYTVYILYRLSTLYVNLRAGPLLNDAVAILFCP